MAAQDIFFTIQKALSMIYLYLDPELFFLTLDINSSI